MAALQRAMRLTRSTRNAANEPALAAACHWVAIAKAAQEWLVPLLKHLPGALLIGDRDIVLERNEGREYTGPSLVAAVRKRCIISGNLGSTKRAL